VLSFLKIVLFCRCASGDDDDDDDDDDEDYDDYDDTITANLQKVCYLQISLCIGFLQKKMRSFAGKRLFNNFQVVVSGGYGKLRISVSNVFRLRCDRSFASNTDKDNSDRCGSPFASQKIE
jgi:hypothetical protein